MTYFLHELKKKSIKLLLSSVLLFISVIEVGDFLPACILTALYDKTALNDFLQKIPVPQHEEMRELATKFKNLIINAFENCIHKIEWEICNDELGYDSTIISMEEYTAEVDKICENIRKLIISSDNMST